MAEVADVAKYILCRLGSLSAMKLQKLVYYSQAWSLVWDDRPLFDSRIEAWANGPVSPELYQLHRAQFLVSPDWFPGNPDALDQDEAETVDAVLSFYADKTPAWLSELTHREEPWQLARVGLAPGERGTAVISLQSMADYYGSLEPLSR